MRVPRGPAIGFVVRVRNDVANTVTRVLRKSGQLVDRRALIVFLILGAINYIRCASSSNASLGPSVARNPDCTDRACVVVGSSGHLKQHTGIQGHRDFKLRRLRRQFDT